jgi:stage V sporulation protein SpoVS
VVDQAAQLGVLNLGGQPVELGFHNALRADEVIAPHVGHWQLCLEGHELALDSLPVGSLFAAGLLDGIEPETMRDQRAEVQAIGAGAVNQAVKEIGQRYDFKGSKTEPPQFTRGYGLVLGQSERKAIAMSLVDRALRWQELGEDFTGAPAQDEEFVMMHCDNIQATGFLEHIKLPHYVDFQAELELVRRLRAEAQTMQEAAE